MMLAALAIGAQPFLATAREPVAKPGACCNKCECCVSRDSDNASWPIAPFPARTTVAKDFQLIPVLNPVLHPTPGVRAFVTFDFSAVDLSAAVPVFIRHCTFLI